jgi:uncharacterized protein (DUF2147 family)
MKLLKGTMMLLFLLMATAFQVQTGDEILGEWLSSSGEGKFRIFKSGEYYYGTIHWIKEPNTEKGEPKLDDNNPDISKRNRKIQGLILLKSFKFNAKNKSWENGEIYDPESGKTYSCKMKMETADKLNIRGYIGISLIGRTEVWTRVK